MRLQGKLLLSVVPAIALSLATLGIAVYGKLSDGISREQRTRMELAMDRVQAASLAYVDVNELNTSLLGDAEPIADFFRALPGADPDHERAAGSVRAMFRRMKRRVPDFMELRLLGRDGKELIRIADGTLANRSEDESDTAWFRRVGLNWAAGLHTDVIPHPDDGSLVLMIARPIEQVDPGEEDVRINRRLRGYLVVAAGLDFLEREVANRAFGESARILVLDAAGKTVFDTLDSAERGSRRGLPGHEAPSLAAALDKHPSDPSATTGPPSRMAFGELETALAAEARGHVDHIDAHGHAFTVYQRPLFGTMKIVAVVPDTAEKRLAAGVAKSVASVTLASIAVTAALFYALVRVLLLSPIRSLQHSAVAIERGGRGRLLIVARRQDELGELATAFHAMHQRLVDSMQAVQVSHDRTERLVFEDRLTGAFNRLWLMTRLDERVASGRTGRADEHRFGLLLVNLEEFKRINERNGLDVGDALLCEIATRLSRCVSHGRHVDAPSAAESTGSIGPVSLARLGGDEFVVSLDDVDGAEQLAGRIAQTLSKPIELGGQMHAVRVNIGMAAYPDDATTVHDLLRCADLALGVAKRGTQEFQRYDQSIRDGIEYRQRLEVELRSAVAAGALELQYQPQMNVVSGRIQGVEALLRWQHPELGFISPELFIPIAEETGLIAVIGRQVMRDACEQWSCWHAEGIAPERVSINVSPRQFRLADVVAEVAEELAIRNMPAEALEVELTESGVADADEELIEALTRFRQMGVRVAMDDFGKGISTLGALAALPIDTLKIDRSFVTGVDTHARTEKVLAATLALIQSLGLEGVAEGVETEAEFRWLQAHGCNIVQGYYFSRPLWAPDASALLREQRLQDSRQAA